VGGRVEGSEEVELSREVLGYLRKINWGGIQAYIYVTIKYVFRYFSCKVQAELEERQYRSS
jgi:hypothetical protein